MVQETIYRITFQNNTGKTGKYSVFNEVPQITGQTTKVWSNIWLSRTVAKAGFMKISAADTVYAFAGKSPEKPREGLVIESGVSQPAALGEGNKPGSTLEMDIEDNTALLDYGPDDRGIKGCFSIETGSDFNASENYLIGLARYSDVGTVVPAATIPATPNSTTQIRPINKFFISQHGGSVGEIIEYASVSKNTGIVDFSTHEANGKFNAIITQNLNGEFVTQFVSQSAFYNAVKRQDEQRFFSQKTKSNRHPLGAIHKQLKLLQGLVSDFEKGQDKENQEANGEIDGQYSD